jgi:hypothetical protein
MNKNTITRTMTGVALLLCLLVIAACGNDAKVESRDTSGAVKYNMPDQFDTVAAKCDGHGHRIFESSGHGLTVIADQSCVNHVGP